VGLGGNRKCSGPESGGWRQKGVKRKRERVSDLMIESAATAIGSDANSKTNGTRQKLLDK